MLFTSTPITKNIYVTMDRYLQHLVNTALFTFCVVVNASVLYF